MSNSARARLLERALALPLARSTDFFGGRRPPGDVDPQHLRLINDSALRARLIGAHIAEGLQSPKGPQKIASIIRIYPGFDAPTREAGSSAPSPAASNGSRSKASAALPTVEEMEQLLTRIRAVEGHVAREMHMAIDAEIERLRKRLAEARADDIEEAHAALGAALDRRRSMTSEIRREAYRRIDHDTQFAPRAFLRLLSD
jgi:hypothetical protein